MTNRKVTCGSSERLSLLGLQNHCRWWLQPWNQKMLVSWQKSDGKPRQCAKKQRLYSANKCLYCQSYGLPSGHVQLWNLNHKEGRMPKNLCLQTVVVKTSESPLDSKEIKPVSFKGDQPWKISGRTDAEAEAPVFWSLDVNRRFIGKIPDAGEDWGQRRGHQRMRRLDGITNSMDMCFCKLWEMVKDREVLRAAVLWGHKELDVT